MKPGPLDHFVFDTISSPQTAGTPFTVTITAQDEHGNTTTTFTGTVALTDTTKTITPTTSGNFMDGVWSGQVTISKAQAGVTITATDDGKTETSNAFDVKPGPPDHKVFLPLVLQNYPPQPNLFTSTKKVDRTFANVGERLRYTITLTNSGTLAAQVQLTDPIPMDTALLGSGTGCTCTISACTWHGTLDSGDIHTCDFEVRINEDASGEIANVATIDDGYHEPFSRSASTQMVVTNPGFETGDFIGWELSGTDVLIPSVVANPEASCFGGNWTALLGTPGKFPEGTIPIGSARITQMIYVPETASELVFRYHMYSYDIMQGSRTGRFYDYLEIHVDGISLKRIGNPAGSTDGDTLWDSGCQTKALSIEEYRGEEIELSFSLWNLVYPEYNSWIYLDDMGFD